MKMGRPKKEIDQKIFEGLCGLQCTRNEILEFFHLTDMTLNRWCKEVYHETFSVVFAKKRGAGKISLRRTGFRLAETSAAAWIFHAKNYLGMRDQPDITQIAPEDAARKMREQAKAMRSRTDGYPSKMD